MLLRILLGILITQINHPLSIELSLGGDIIRPAKG